MPEKLLTVKELAEILGVNTETIYREIKKTDCSIPYKRIGSSYRFVLADVLRATEANNASPEEPKNERDN